MIIIVIIIVLLEERPLSTWHLHSGQRLGRKIALHKIFTDPDLQFCLATETAVRMYVCQKCTCVFFPSCHFKGHYWKAGRWIKGMNAVLHNNLTYKVHWKRGTLIIITWGWRWLNSLILLWLKTVLSLRINICLWQMYVYVCVCKHASMHASVFMCTCI